METIKEEKKAEYETMLQCFDSVIFYNGYSDFFRDVYKLFKKYMEEWWAEKHEWFFSLSEFWRNEEIDRFAYWQLQVLRMMLVEMFGDCWTSPRSWWITDEKWFDEFMSELLNRLSE